MERRIIVHQKRKNIKLPKRVNVPKGYEIHHKIPYCISEDDSYSNLIIMKKEKHRKISGIDRIVLNKMKKLKIIETVTHYSMEINVSLEEARGEFLRIKEIVLDTLD